MLIIQQVKALVAAAWLCLYMKLQQWCKSLVTMEEDAVAAAKKSGVTSDATPSECDGAMVLTDSTRVLSTKDSLSLMELPHCIVLQVAFFLYDDGTSLQALFASCKALSSISPGTVKKYIRQDIILSSDDIFCSICSSPVTYPYKLVDCAHVACGRCAWHSTECVSCKTKIRSRPQRLLGPELAHARAFWLLSPRENALRVAKNEARIHNGTVGFFGKHKRQNELDPFEGKGYPADFDDIKEMHVSDLDLLPVDRGKLWVTVCPAAYNYSGFPKFSGTAKTVERYVQSSSFLEDLDEDVIVIIEQDMTEEEVYSNQPRPDRYEVRLVMGATTS